MCRRSNATVAPGAMRRSSSLLLLTHDSFVIPDVPDKDDANKKREEEAQLNPHLHGLGGPSVYATLLTVAFYIAVLFLLEHATRALLAREDTVALVPILEKERNRHVLARHLAVDFLSLLVCSVVAWVNRHACADLLRHTASFGRSDSMSEEGFEERVFGYHPGSQRLLTLFFVYQVKNMYDTILWGDGIVFVLHHILAGIAAWGGMFPGCCHFYCLFYMGFSEISTAILVSCLLCACCSIQSICAQHIPLSASMQCLLANFDPELGVVGLDEAFPKTKIFIAAVFVVSFIVCRVIMWPFVTYYFHKDIVQALRSRVPRAEGRKGYLRLIWGVCIPLTFIQLVFVAMIVQEGKKEWEKLTNSGI
ncbi:hypothetical protein ACHAWF_009051 [Thalassiosira exigua]